MSEIDRNAPENADRLFAAGPAHNSVTVNSSSYEPFIEIDLHQVLAALRRNLVWVAVIVTTFMIMGVVISMLIVPRYVATASVLIEQQADQIIENSDVTPTDGYQDVTRFLNTQIDVIKSRALAERVMEALNLASSPRFYEAVGAEMPEKEDLEGINAKKGGLDALRKDMVIGLLQEYLSVDLPNDSRVARISFESRDPALSAKIADAFAENLISTNLNRKFDSSSYARDFLAQQLQEVRQKLENSERELNQYSRTAGLIRVPGQGQNADRESTLSITAASLVQVNIAASEATADRVAAQERWEAIKSTPVMSIPQVLANPAVQGLIRQRSEVQAKLAEERARHLNNHPTIQALQAQAHQLEVQILTVGDSIKRSVYVDYQAALDKERALQGRVQKLQGAALDEQDRGVRYNVLKRVAETDRALYDSLLARYNQLSATAGAVSNNISLIDRADVPRSPSSPNLALNLLLSLIAGLGFASIFILLREYFDDAVRAPEDVETKLGLPLLGLVPMIDCADVDAAWHDRKSAAGEAYASLVANLRWATASGLPHSLVITSTQPSEGKSTTARAIASDIAALGKKVLLIDADMRRPTLHRFISKPEPLGLPALLTGEATLEEVVYSGHEDGFDCVTALPITPDPAILLGSPRLARILEETQQRYDIVILDGPPMLGLSDMANLSVHAQAVLMVVDASLNHRGAVKASLRRLQMVRANILGALLTKFDPTKIGKKLAYYGSDYYSYGNSESK